MQEQVITKQISDIKLAELESQPDDVIAAMRRNVAELTGYYTINKQQARSAFTAALLICFLGFILFAGGVIITYMTPEKTSIIAYSTIAGAIVEIIAGSFFWLYSEALKQINKFHDQLIHTQELLTTIQIASNLTKNERDNAYLLIIKNLLNDILKGDQKKHEKKS
ncbi:MAG TPA: hypothetical protein VF399_07465 [bacterium]